MRDRAFISSTAGVAAKREFYSSRSNEYGTLDDQITAAESEYSRIHRELVACDEPQPTSAARLLTHLTVRCAHLRESLGFVGTSTIQALLTSLQNPTTFRKVVGMAGPKPMGPFKKAIDKRYSELRATSGRKLSRYEFQMLAHRMFNEKFDDIFLNAVISGHILMDALRTKFPEMASTGHNEALGKGLEPNQRVELYESFRWTVHDYPGDQLVLPDSVAVLKGASEKGMSPLYQSAEDRVPIYFPISSSRLLIASDTTHDRVPPTDFNRWAAQASWELFLSHPDVELGSDLPLEIRAGADELIGKLLSDMMLTGFE